VDVSVVTRSGACLLISAAASLLAAAVARAQNPCDSSTVVRETELVGVGSDYTRLIELRPDGHVTPRLGRRLSNSMTSACKSGPWQERTAYQVMNSGLTFAPLAAYATINSAYPEDRNNGSLWSGRGAATAIEGGVVLRLGAFSMAVLPILTFQQNGDYEMLPPAGAAGKSVYANGLYGSVDAPQRFGPEGYSTAGWGQSYARLDVWKLGVGFSNENMWWGPGISNAILFTNTAPGFPHVFLNARKPINVGIGTLTGEMVWGKLSESEYFDTIPANNHRMIVGGLITLQPRWVRGLYLGLGRTFVMPWDSISGRNLFPFSQTFWKKNLATPGNPTGSSSDDQRVSLMARYVFPESHFELYGEWAREDHAWNTSDFIQEPEHASGHVIGAQKVFMPSVRRWVRSYAEATNLQILRQSRTGIRSTGSFYTHRPQGHTQLGQLLGASIGPGGESQLFGVDVIGRTGAFGGYLERVRRDEFSPRGIAAWSTVWPPRHDVAVTGGLRLTRFVGELRADAELSRSKRYNRSFVRNESNSRVQLRLSWLPGQGKASHVPVPPATPSDSL
jgi:hypothetical protein